MKIIMTLLVRNEEDIIRENIEFHLSQGVNYFIATDNLSVDGTTNILKEYQEKGVLRYFFEDSNQFDQHKWVTQMARLAFKEHGADWVINNDADEFWWPRAGSLSNAFEDIPDDVNVVDVDRTNFVMVAGDNEPFFKRMVFRQAVPINSLGRPLPSKTAHRGTEQVVIFPGNHSVSGFPIAKNRYDGIEVLHFPMRSYSQFESKIKLGGAAYERNIGLPESVGVTWRKLYSELQSCGSLREHYYRNTYNGERIKKGIANGEIIEDKRLMEYLSKLPGLRRH